LPFENKGENISVADYISKLKVAQEGIIRRAQKHQDNMVQKYLEKGDTTSHPFEVGDLVLWKYPTAAPTKLSAAWKGLLVVIERYNDVYEIQDLISDKITKVSRCDLKKYQNDILGIPARRVAQVHADRFCAVFQTDWQRETMKQWLVQIPVILMDTTHNVTRYRGIFLTTIMVIRPNSGGCDGIRYNGIPFGVACKRQASAF